MTDRKPPPPAANMERTVFGQNIPEQANPAQANSEQANSEQANSEQANPAQANPSQANPSQAIPTQVNPTQVNPTPVNPEKVNPEKANPSQAIPERPDQEKSISQQLTSEQANSDSSHSEDPHTDRLNRCQFRAWHRGTREADYMMGCFFDSFHSAWSEAELQWFEALLERDDADVMGWALQSAPVPQQFQGDLMVRMQLLDYVKIPQ